MEYVCVRAGVSQSIMGMLGGQSYVRTIRVMRPRHRDTKQAAVNYVLYHSRGYCGAFDLMNELSV